MNALQKIWHTYSYSLIGILVIAGATVILYCIFLNLFNSYDNKRTHTKYPWFGKILQNILLPGKWFIWLFGIFIEVEWLWHTIPPIQKYIRLEILQDFRNLILVVLITWIILRVKKITIRYYLEKDKKKVNLNASLATALSKLGTLLILLLSSLVILSIFNMPLQAFLTFGGVGTLAFSWAAKDFIANLFGGLMIHINRPFHVGDWIKSSNKNFEGVVEKIGWYMTQIRTFERRPTYIPNGLMTDAILENPGRMYNRRIKADIGVRYDDFQRIEKIVPAIEKMLKEHPDIAVEQILMVHFLEFADSSLIINIYCFTRTTQWAEYRSVQQNVFLKIGKIIEEHGGEIAFPTRTLHLFNHEEK